MPRPVDQRKLVRTRGVVDDVLFSLFRLLRVSDDSVAETESLMEALQVLIVLMGPVVDVLVELRVLEVNICDAWRVFNRLRVVFTVLKLAGRKSLELHDVLGERACLVAENVVHHAELLVQVGGLDRGLKTSILVADLDVNGDEVRLDKVDHFQGHQE